MNAKDKLLGFSEDKTQAFVVGSDGKFNVIQTGMRTEPKEGKLTDAKATREQFNSASINDNFPDLVNRFANTMSLDEIYKAYSNTAKGKKYGTPNENTREINFLYKVAKGEMTPEEARSKLEE